MFSSLLRLAAVFLVALRGATAGREKEEAQGGPLATEEEPTTPGLQKCTIQSRDDALVVSFPVESCSFECQQAADWKESGEQASASLNIAKQFALRFKSSWQKVKNRCVCSAEGEEKIQFKLKDAHGITEEECQQGEVPRVQLKCWKDYESRIRTEIISEHGKGGKITHRTHVVNEQLLAKFYDTSSQRCTPCEDDQSCSELKLPSIAERLPRESKQVLALELNKIRSGEVSLEGLTSGLGTLKEFSDSLVTVDTDLIQFAGFNTNQDGNVDIKELKKYFVNDKITEDQVEKAFEAADKNGDHGIGLDEFRTFKDKLRYRWACWDAQEGKLVDGVECTGVEKEA